MAVCRWKERRKEKPGSLEREVGQKQNGGSYETGTADKDCLIYCAFSTVFGHGYNELHVVLLYSTCVGYWTLPRQTFLSLCTVKARSQYEL